MNNNNMVSCPRCYGEGWIPILTPGTPTDAEITFPHQGSYKMELICPTCKGKKTIDAELFKHIEKVIKKINYQLKEALNV